MKFPEPISSVFPGLHGRVVSVLARTNTPLTGRAVSTLLTTPASVSGVQKVLDDLVLNGVVRSEPAGRAKLYTLNREHVAYPGIKELTSLRETFISRLTAEAQAWEIPAAAVWLFGSTARGQGGPESDVDILVVRPDAIDDSDPVWLRQVETIREHATLWSGNACEILEFGARELKEFVGRGERLVADLRKDAISLAGAPPRQSLTRRAG
jgi:predicted nucleotidyltransferase